MGRRYINVRIDTKGGGKGGKGGGGGGKGKGKRDFDGGYEKGEKGGKGGKRFEDRTTFDGELQNGTVARWFSDRGFGYITPDEGDGDIFVHFSAIRSSGGFRDLTENQRVSFGMEPDPKGKGKGGMRA